MCFYWTVPKRATVIFDTVTFTFYSENQDEHEDVLHSAANMLLLLGKGGPIIR